MDPDRAEASGRGSAPGASGSGQPGVGDPPVPLPRTLLDALVFDLDGVLTDTASLHLRAWRETFDAFLREHPEADDRPFSDEDYRRYVDGRPRYDGAQAFLHSRGVDLPRGQEDDPPGTRTVCGVGNRKNQRFQQLLGDEGVDPFRDALALVERARELDFRLGVITSSRNGRLVLEAADLARHFDVTLDGVDVRDLSIPGKPDPAIFLSATRRMDVDPDRTAVFEDSRAGVEAGRRGGFRLVVGVDRTANGTHRESLARAGADRVVPDLSHMAPTPDGISRRRIRPIRELPTALEHFPEIWEEIGPRPALLLDYDGVLTPIVDDPETARLPVETRAELQALAGRCTVAIVSGRDLDQLRRLVDLDGLWYAGSHGLHLMEADGTVHERAGDHLPLLDEAGEALKDLPDRIPGVTLERKRFGLAVHYRRVRERDRVPEVVARAREAARSVSRPGLELRLQEGKEVAEIRPDLDWDKGSAVGWILARSGRGDPPVYIGDDITDEDAFRVLPGSGLGIVVRGEGDDRETAARFVLLDTDRVRHFLRRVRETMDRVEDGPAPAGEVAP